MNFITILLVVIIASVSSQILNGGFEDNSCESDLWCDYGEGSFCPDWNCFFGTVDIHESNPTQLSCYEGSYCVDLSGNYEGGIDQTFNTISGHSYTISWYQSGNPNCGDIVKTMYVQVSSDHGENAPQYYSFDVSNTNYGHMEYVQATYSFTAVDETSTVYYTSTEPSSCGVVVDAISLTDNIQEVCNNADQSQWTYDEGYYCYGAGFVQCWGDSSDVFAAYQDCPLGTSCSCASEVECSNHGTESPCT